MEVVGIFILPPSKKELVNRLKTRGRDTKNEMKKRMNLVQMKYLIFLNMIMLLSIRILIFVLIR